MFVSKSILLFSGFQKLFCHEALFSLMKSPASWKAFVFSVHLLSFVFRLLVTGFGRDPRFLRAPVTDCRLVVGPFGSTLLSILFYKKMLTFHVPLFDKVILLRLLLIVGEVESDQQRDADNSAKSISSVVSSRIKVINFVLKQFPSFSHPRIAIASPHSHLDIGVIITSFCVHQKEGDRKKHHRTGEGGGKQHHPHN